MDINMSELTCRLCAKQSASLMNIFNNVMDNEIHSKIKDCVGVSIEENDGIPATLCGQCFFLIKAFAELRTAAIKNDIKLKGELEENKRIAKSVTKQVENTLPIAKESKKNASTSAEQISNLVSNEAPKLITETPKDTGKECVQVQSNFMKELNLITKSQKLSIKKQKKIRTRYHPSVGRIKAAYPKVNIPSKCFKWHMNPVVIVNNKIVDDWIEMNKKDTSSNESSWTVNRHENNTLSLSLTRIPENLEVLLDEFEKDQIDDDNVLSDSKSDSSFSPATSSYESDESTLSYASGSSKGTYNKINLRRKRSSNRKEKETTKIRKLCDTNIKNKRNIKPNDDSTKFNDEDLARMKKSILDALLSKKEVVMPSSNSEINPNHNVSMEKTSEERTPEEVLKVPSKPEPIDKKLKETEIADNDNTFLMETNRISQTFICQTCNGLFYSQRALNDHKRHHSKNTLRCQICSESFSIVEALVKHNSEEHANISSTDNKKPIESHQEKLSNTVEPLIDVPSTSGVCRIAKKSTTKASSFKIEDGLKKQQLQNSEPISDPIKTEEDNCVVISDDETEVRKDKENRPKDDNGLTLYNLLAGNNVHYNSSNVANSTEMEKPPEVKKPNPVPSLPPSEELICLRNIVKKYKSKRVVLPKNPDFIYTQESCGTIQRFSRGVELTGITSLLDKSYIPVELVPRLGGNSGETCELSVRYNFNSAQRPKPKNTSYKWDTKEAVDALNKNIPDLPTAASKSTTVSVITSNPNANKVGELEQKQCTRIINTPKLPIPDFSKKPSESPPMIVPNSDKQVTPSNQPVTKPDKPPFVAQLLPDGSYQLCSNGKVAISRYSSSLTSSTVVQKNHFQSVLRPIPPKNTYPPKRPQVSNLNNVTHNLTPSSTMQILNMTPSIVTSISHPNLSKALFSTSSNTMQNLNLTSNTVNTNSNISVINVNNTMNGSVALQNMTNTQTSAVAANALNSLHNLNTPNLLLYHTNEQTNLNLHNFISINLPVSSVSTPTSMLPNMVSQNTIMAPAISSSHPGVNIPTQHTSLQSVNIPTQHTSFQSVNIPTQHTSLPSVNISTQHNSLPNNTFPSVNIPTQQISLPNNTFPSVNMPTQQSSHANNTFPNIPTQQTSLPNNTFPSVSIPTQQNSVVSDESVAHASKPLIRIKSLSELMEANTAQSQDRSLLQDRTSLQDLYAQTVSSYVNAFKPNTQNTLDEYLQIQ